MSDYLPDGAWAVIARGDRGQEGVLVWSVPEGAEVQHHVYGMYLLKTSAQRHARLYGGRIIRVAIREVLPKKKERRP